MAKLSITYDGVTLDVDTDDIPNRLVRPMQAATGWTMVQWWQAVLEDDSEAWEWLWRFACLLNDRDPLPKDADFFPGRVDFDFSAMLPDAEETEPAQGPTGPPEATGSQT